MWWKHLPKKIMEVWMASCDDAHSWNPCGDKNSSKNSYNRETRSQPAIQQERSGRGECMWDGVINWRPMSTVWTCSDVDISTQSLIACSTVSGVSTSRWWSSRICRRRIALCHTCTDALVQRYSTWWCMAHLGPSSSIWTLKVLILSRGSAVGMTSHGRCNVSWIRLQCCHGRCARCSLQ